MPEESRRSLLSVSRAALFRYQVVSEVRARRLAGEPLARAVRAVAKTTHVTLSGEHRTVGVRSIYRWLKDYQQGGLDELADAPHEGAGAGAFALPSPLLDFLVAEKGQDRYASVPELIRRARERGLVGPDDRIDRTTVFRACVRLGLPLRRVPGKHEADQRRFAYPHRMMMVLCDGKHFRAGAHRARRVALFFLDDATRYALGVVVGTAGESAALFLRGLYQVVRANGFFDVAYLDQGPGFIADDTHTALARLGSALVLGRGRYPEGHGKIERFHFTAWCQVLRGLAGAAGVDADPGALELRLGHYLTERYNLSPHEALDLETPRARWEADPRPLRFPDDDQALRARFVTTESRKVSSDNVISYQGQDYEVPRGHAKTEIQVQRRLLGGELAVVHDGRLVVLHPVDLAHNALDRRAQAPRPDDDEGTPTTAAQLAFQRDFRPVVGSDGGVDDPLSRGGKPR